MRKPKMILFDYGGTLCEERNVDFLRAEKELFRFVTANPHHITPEEACAEVGEIFEKFGEIRKKGFEVDECQVQRLTNDLLGLEFSLSAEEIADLIFRHSCRLEPMPHVRELLTYLKDNGIRTGVISNIAWLCDSLAARIREALPESDFEFVITSSEYGIRKPDPMLFEIALNRAGLEADDVWYCGDNWEADVCGARNAGMTPVWYTDKQGDCLCVKDWRELIAVLEQCDTSGCGL